MCLFFLLNFCFCFLPCFYFPAKTGVCRRKAEDNSHYHTICWTSHTQERYQYRQHVGYTILPRREPLPQISTMQRREELFVKYLSKQLNHHCSIYERVNFSRLLPRGIENNGNQHRHPCSPCHPSFVASNRRRPGQLHNRHNYSQTYYNHRMHCNCHIKGTRHNHIDTSAWFFHNSRCGD